jgi:hypothetical protein
VDLRCGGLVGVVQGVQPRHVRGAVQESRSKPTWETHCQAQPAMNGWPAEWREGWSE